MLALKVGLVISQQELWNEVQACLNELPVRIQLQKTAIGDVAGFAAEVNDLGVDLLFLDLTDLKQPAESVIKRLKSVPADPMIIALSDRADPEMILAAMRAGANEFLYPPLEPALRKAVERLAAERAKSLSASSAQGKTLAFVSAKGGCGATTVACHVAVELQRVTGKDVLLADFDIDSGIVGFLMKANSDYSIIDAVRNVNRLDLTYFKALVSNGHAKLEVISAPPAGVARQIGDPEPFRYVLRFMRTAYDWTIIDFGRSLNAFTASLVPEIDQLFLLTTLDLPALHQSKRLVEALGDLGYSGDRLHIVLNRSPKRPDITGAELERVLGAPIFDVLPNSYPELHEAYSEGKLLPAGSELGKALAGMAAKVAGVKLQEKTRARSTFSLF